MEDLISVIVEERYGTDSSKVARALYVRQHSTFKSLLDSTGLNEQSLRVALTTLMHQLLVSFDECPKQVYYLLHSEVFCRLRYPKYIRHLYSLYGEYCPIEDVLEHGCCTISKLLYCAQECWDVTEPTNRIIGEMIGSEYLIPVQIKEECRDSIVTTPVNKTGEPRKKMKLNSVVDLIFKKTDKNCAVICEAMYKLGDRGVSLSEISAEFPEATFEVLERGFTLLRNNNLVEGVRENTWKLNLPVIINTFCSDALEQAVIARFGDYSSRVFRTLCNINDLDEKTISELANLCPRETHISLNELVEAGFLSKRAMGDSQVLYGVRLEEMKHKILLQTYQNVLDLKVKLNGEISEMWALAERVGLLSSEEHQALGKYKNVEVRIEKAILELDKTIMMLSHEF